MKNILGTWRGEFISAAKFVIDEKMYRYVGDDETADALYIIDNDSIKLFYNDDDIMRRGRIKAAPGKQLTIEWEGGNERKYQRYR